MTAALTASLLSAAAPSAGADAAPRVHAPVAQAIEALPVAEESREGYKRSAFRHWIDEDRDGCDTRREVLIEEATEAPTVGPRCRLTGGKWHSYYDEVDTTSARGLDIDHLVPLAEAWDSGASQWSAKRRQAYANDLGWSRSLVAVSARSNRQKSDQDPSTWWVPAASASCQYLTDWIGVKTRWGLSVDDSELAALRERAEQCPDSTVDVPMVN
ncbi:HNH endonuclease [Streptomyces sp. NHF165]|nr:HNH endonuclease [Streptomyces sp. NHF165]